MPPTFRSYGERWVDLHPGWELTDWSHPTAIRGMRATSRHLIDSARHLCPRDWRRFQADVARLEVLWLHGGVYVDTDVQPRQPLDGWLAEYGIDTDGLPYEVCVAGRSPQSIRSQHPITNAVMIATPRHPFVGACLDRLPRDAHAPGLRGRPLAQRIGPWMLTRVYEAGWWPTVLVVPAAELYGDRSPLQHMWNSARRRRGVPLG